jgi:hypothetical protein
MAENSANFPNENSGKVGHFFEIVPFSFPLRSSRTHICKMSFRGRGGSGGDRGRGGGGGDRGGGRGGGGRGGFRDGGDLNNPDSIVGM